MLHAQHLLVMQKGCLVGKMWELVFRLYRTNSLKTASLSVTCQKKHGPRTLGIWIQFLDLSLAWWAFFCLGYFSCIMKPTALLSLAELRTGFEVLWKGKVL